MVSSGLVQPGSEIKIVYSGCCVDVCVVQKDGKVIDKKTGEVHDRPSQLWSKNKHARKISWWDVWLCDQRADPSKYKERGVIAEESYFSCPWRLGVKTI